jgi:hypothetical protein
VLLGSYRRGPAAEAIGHGLGLPAGPVPDEDARACFTFLTDLVGVENPVSSAKTRELLGWPPPT